jgi:hypothetical protein
MLETTDVAAGEVPPSRASQILGRLRRRTSPSHIQVRFRTLLDPVRPVEHVEPRRPEGEDVPDARLRDRSEHHGLDDVRVRSHRPEDPSRVPRVQLECQHVFVAERRIVVPAAHEGDPVEVVLVCAEVGVPGFAVRGGCPVDLAVPPGLADLVGQDSIPILVLGEGHTRVQPEKDAPRVTQQRPALRFRHRLPVNRPLPRSFIGLEPPVQQVRQRDLTVEEVIHDLVPEIGHSSSSLTRKGVGPCGAVLELPQTFNRGLAGDRPADRALVGVRDRGWLVQLVERLRQHNIETRGSKAQDGPAPRFDPRKPRRSLANDRDLPEGDDAGAAGSPFPISS